MILSPRSVAARSIVLFAAVAALRGLLLSLRELAEDQAHLLLRQLHDVVQLLVPGRRLHHHLGVLGLLLRVLARVHLVPLRF